jgi:hypothetical protein
MDRHDCESLLSLSALVSHPSTADSSLPSPARFPLYSKGVERYRFEYAVYLLNKDIESVRPRSDRAVATKPGLILAHCSWQLMVDRDIKIMDLRHTLPNLMNLLLTVSSDWPAK